MRIGRYDLHTLHCGHYALDGGSMFGIVPKALWQRRLPADDRNRIPLVTRSLLAIDRAAGRVILVDSGFGNKWSADERDRFAYDFDSDPLGGELARHGVGDDDVTDVLVTHLHFDHNAGLTVGEPGQTEGCRPRFTRAQHWIHAGQLEHALRPATKDRGSYYPRDYTPVQAAGLFRPIADPGQIDLPDVSFEVSHGHTTGQLLPRFEGDGQAALYTCDLIPTAHHLPLPWLLAFDNEPLRSTDEKRAVLQRTAERDEILVFVHDRDCTAARIDNSGKYAVVRDVVAI